MPFKKITSGKDKGKYRSPSGRVWTEKQVKLYYVTEGFTKEPNPAKLRAAKRRKK